MSEDNLSVEEVQKVPCEVLPGQTLQGIYAGGTFTEGQEVQLIPEMADFYAAGGVVKILGGELPPVTTPIPVPPVTPAGATPPKLPKTLADIPPESISK
jgi:hypothetical protein